MQPTPINQIMQSVQSLSQGVHHAAERSVWPRQSMWDKSSQLRLLAILMLGLGGFAFAAPSCAVTTIAPDLGHYSWLEVSSGTGLVQINCAGAGNNPGTSGGARPPAWPVTLRLMPPTPTGERELRQGNERLTYQIYADAARQQLIGTTFTVQATFDGRGTDIPLYFVIPAYQMVPSGLYQATLSVSIEF